MLGRVAFCLLLAACGRLSFDAAAPVDAGVDAMVDCTTLPDGTLCDDRNVCTAISTCQAGACVAAMDAAATCTLARSEPDFSTTQGARGWWYGYWWAEIDPDGAYDPATDFRELAFGTSVWSPPDYDPNPASPNYTWCYVAAWGAHPGDAPRKLPVRRWISDVSGPASLTIAHSKADATGGDGTRAIILVDGQERWRHDVDGFDSVGVTVEVPVELHVGTIVDYMLDPIAGDAVDTTNESMIVHSP